MTENIMQEKNVQGEIVQDEIEMSMIRMVNAHADVRKKERELIRKGRIQAMHESKKKIRKNRIVRILSFFVFFVSLAFLIWVMASWVNVYSNTMSPETVQNIWDFNFFKVLFS